MNNRRKRREKKGRVKKQGDVKKNRSRGNWEDRKRKRENEGGKYWDVVYW